MNWDSIPLTDAFWFQEGPGVRKWQFKSEGVKLLNVGNITVDGQIDLDATDRHLSNEEANGKYSHFLVNTGDLVIASSGISFDKDGFLRTKIAFIESHHLPLCMNTSTIRFKANQNIGDLSYLKHWLQSFEFRAQVSKFVTGSAQLNFGPSHLKKMTIKLPPLPEQKRIAAILDQADALRRQRQRALDHLNQLGQSIFYEMFLDGGNYEKKDLIDCVDRIQIGPFGSLLHQADYIENGIPLVNPKHINGGKIEPQTKVSITEKKYEELERYHMRTGDVVMARRGEMGRCAVVDAEANGYLCGTGSLFIRSNLDLIRPFFLQRFLSSPRTIQILENEASGVTMLNLNAKALKALPIPTPPISKQIEFEEKVSERSVLTKSMELNHQKLEDLFASLQQRAFRGEL
ncbi:restriction endonuclease subunit S [Litorimonas sp. WD9-15]|uniref:restriction endonuclease subunit S n=1 Tax=Litorimonas sp. WD9-15 TaxID=3418716 RepID=UPI003CFD6BFC